MLNNPKISRQDIFPTPIWDFFIDNNQIDFNSIIKECLLEKENDKNGRQISNFHGWQSQLLPFNKYKETNKLFNEIVKNSIDIINDFGIKKIFKISIDEYWININNQNGYNKSHIHAGTLLSGVIYIKAPENSGNIEFEVNPLINYIVTNYCDATNHLNYRNVFYKPIDKKVIIFPSYIPHFVNENLTNEDRISIAFNYTMVK
jgi:uncharacterized protein (TIGR02466 family)